MHKVCQALGNVVKQGSTTSFHYSPGNGVYLIVHEELLVVGEFHDNDPEVGSAQVQREELSLLAAVGQVPNVGGETLDTRRHLALLLQPFLYGPPHGLLYDVDMVVVEAKVPDAVLDETPPPAQNVGLVGLQDLPHQSLGHLVPGLGQTLLHSLPEVRHVSRSEAPVKVRVASDKRSGLGSDIFV